MTGAEQLFVDVERLAARLDALAEIGPLEPGGSSRLAFTEL